MTLSQRELESDSWAFALDLYARPGVADACLNLQNEAGVDVLILLMITYAALRHRILLTPDQIVRLDEASRPWREQIVQPLRAVRTVLKTGPLPAPSSETERFRSTVKTAELAAERLQNHLLAESLPLGPASNDDDVDAEQLRSALQDAVTSLLERRGKKPITDFRSSIDLIVDAAMAGSP